MELVRRAAHRRLRISFVTVSSRLTGEIGSSSNPISGMIRGDFAFDLFGFFSPSAGPGRIILSPRFPSAASFASLPQWRDDIARSEDRLSRRIDSEVSTNRDPRRLACFGRLSRSDSPKIKRRRYDLRSSDNIPNGRSGATPMQVNVPVADLPVFDEKLKPDTTGEYHIFKNEGNSIKGLGPGEYLVNANRQVIYKMQRNFPSDLRADTSQLGPPEKIKGAQASFDNRIYRVWQRVDPAGGPAQRYLVDENGEATYLVDPGINGTHHTRPDGSAVVKFDAPKATLMSYIIKEFSATNCRGRSCFSV